MDRLVRSFALRFSPGAVAAAAIAICLTGCADRAGGPIPYNVALGAPDEPKIVAIENGYRIAPLDTISIRVFKMPDLSGDYEVDLTGAISMPLIGSVAAADLTTAELDSRLTQVYGAKYLQNPDISVGVKSSTRRSVTVDGSVKSTGSFPVTAPLTLMQAVALAGGTAEDANPRRVAVFRTVDGKRQAAAFDLASIRRGQAVDPPVYAGDIIVVDGSRLKALQKNLLSNITLLSIFKPL